MASLLNHFTRRLSGYSPVSSECPADAIDDMFTNHIVNNTDAVRQITADPRVDIILIGDALAHIYCGGRVQSGDRLKLIIDGPQRWQKDNLLASLKKQGEVPLTGEVYLDSGIILDVSAVIGCSAKPGIQPTQVCHRRTLLGNYRTWYCSYAHSVCKRTILAVEGDRLVLYRHLR